MAVPLFIGAILGMGGGTVISLAAMDGEVYSSITLGIGSVCCGAYMHRDGEGGQASSSSSTTPTGYLQEEDDWGGKTTWSTIGDGFEVQCVQNSGDTISGDSLSTWLTLDTDREWYVSDTGSPGPAQAANITISLRRVGGATLDTATIDISCEIQSGP